MQYPGTLSNLLAWINTSETSLVKTDYEDWMTLLNDMEYRTEAHGRGKIISGLHPILPS